MAKLTFTTITVDHDVGVSWHRRNTLDVLWHLNFSTIDVHGIANVTLGIRTLITCINECDAVYAEQPNKGIISNLLHLTRSSNKTRCLG